MSKPVSVGCREETSFSDRTKRSSNAVGQICSTSSIGDSLTQCDALIRRSSSLGAKALFLPEASDYISSTPAESIALASSPNAKAFVEGLRDLARKFKICVSVGVHEPAKHNKVKNVLLWIDENGVISHKYQKIHLFDVDIAGGPVLKESNSVERGLSICPPFPTPVGQLGMQICFDMRFPALSSHLTFLGAQTLLYPSAFTVPTGRVHWKPLLQARAIENQAYVIAAAQCGPHTETRRSYGNSLIISPWGEVLAELGSWEEGIEGEEAKKNGVGAPAIAVADVDLNALIKVRREMPLVGRVDGNGKVIVS